MTPLWIQKTNIIMLFLLTLLAVLLLNCLICTYVVNLL